MAGVTTGRYGGGPIRGYMGGGAIRGGMGGGLFLHSDVAASPLLKRCPAWFITGLIVVGSERMGCWFMRDPKLFIQIVIQVIS